MPHCLILRLKPLVQALLVAGLLLPGPARAQQHLSLWDTTAVQRCKLDVPLNIPFDEAKPLNQALLDPTVNWHETLVKANPAEGSNEALVAQLSLGASTASLFSPQDTALRYAQLLTPGVVHGALSLLGAHYVDEHIRIWAQGSVGLRLHNYRPDQTGSNYQLWQRYAGLGGGIGYRRSAADRNDRFALNVLWGQASYDLSDHTLETFGRQFGPDPTASFVELSARARLSRLSRNGALYITYSWKRFYKDYDKPSLALVGISASFPIARDNSP